MLVSYKWLNEMLDLSQVSAEELADKMSRTGIEVEEVKIPEQGLKKIVVGDVKECVPHPDSDHLSICQVDVGEDELYQIVCGAPNVEAGKKVIVAMPNSRITGNTKIKKGKMRGVVSMGMLCSLDELGYSDSVVPKEFSDGIYIMPEEAIPGEPVFSYLDMDDAIIELSITPNRADALSMRGVAYEVGAIYRQTPSFSSKVLTEDTNEKASDYISAIVENKEDVPNYRVRIIKDITVKPSPVWLQNRLMNEGIRPVNNIVDVTNFVLLLFGQPMHAFDYEKIGSKEIVVRRGQQDEKIVTLDEQERQVTPENIVVTNGQTPIALAGIMGGYDSEITSKTTTVVLEAATFAGVITRKSAKQFGLRSESSSRFEKGINLDTVQEALEYAAAMIAELGDGRVVAGEVVASETKAPETQVAITLSKINRSLGTALTVKEVNDILEALGFEFVETNEAYVVSIPGRRWDISIEADIIEEVARIYGYDNLPSTLPSGEALPGALTTEQALVRTIRESLEGNGVSEAISYALTTETKATQFTVRPEPVVALQSPMSEDHGILRQSLITGLLEDVAYNVARKNTDLALYEIGKVFSLVDGQKLPKETRHLALAMTGLTKQATWQESKVPVDFYVIKGALESIFNTLGLSQAIKFEGTAEFPQMHPGRTAKIMAGDTMLGMVGQIHPLSAKAYDVPETYVAELNLDALLEVESTGIVYQAVSKFPAMSRDMALLVDTTVSNQELIDVIRANGGKFLQDVKLFDIFQGEKLGLNKKSMAYSLTFLNREATLVDEDVTKATDKIQAALVEEFSVEIR
ncbi:phenylalanine--tRNA ligase subunit beta [Vagococcus intermedius]|uniref:Phenylalanine--tRNA ligase beta subunit n=1 Tax=Vagococcus intermedius TaxID=2991418 RepID=A0AAF0CTM9_9ENTE|nr:phenylalanine--tRNA ligase subunit beta [Vagococcus intermedius]WEG72681.1 phenylalanine--tRNA ligase subunit beta [Vagococcus intermedius]WEG74766.1 phenylalanine--tRNA ligase subunit beta [Vagococcus intermedius]